MNKTMTLRKLGPALFIETIAREGTQFLATRSYQSWEDVEKQLREIGLSVGEIERLKSDFDSGKDMVLIPLP